MAVGRWAQLPVGSGLSDHQTVVRKSFAQWVSGLLSVNGKTLRAVLRVTQAASNANQTFGQSDVSIRDTAYFSLVQGSPIRGKVEYKDTCSSWRPERIPRIVARRFLLAREDFAK